MADETARGFTLNAWTLGDVPGGWEPIEGLGLRHAGEDVLPSTVVFVNDTLREDENLDQYLERQFTVLGEILDEAEITDPKPARVAGTEEALEISIRSRGDDEKIVVQRQVYTRTGKHVGVVTCTTEQNELPSVETIFDSILAKLSFDASAVPEPLSPPVEPTQEPGEVP